MNKFKIGDRVITNDNVATPAMRNVTGTVVNVSKGYTYVKVDKGTYSTNTWYLPHCKWDFLQAPFTLENWSID